MKKTFENLELVLLSLANEDIITESPGVVVGGRDEFGDGNTTEEDKDFEI